MTDNEFARLKAVSDLLMAAAYADGRLEGIEKKKVVDILGVVVEDPAVRAKLAWHLDRFSPDGFDLQATCDALGKQSRMSVRMLLSLLAQVVDADGVQDAEESDFVRRVAAQIGATPETYADLANEALSIGPLISSD